MTQMAQNRRRFLATLSAAGATRLIGPSNSFAQEAPPETTIIRLAKNCTICIAPQYVVADLLRLEGFTEVHYVATDAGAGQSKALAQGDIDFTVQFSALTLIPIDAGERITIIAGIPRRMFRAVWVRRHSQHREPQGEDGGDTGVGYIPACVLVDHGRSRRA